MGINTPLQRDLAVQIEEVAGAHEAMVRRRVVFSEVVGKVVGSFAPVDMIVALGDTVFDPVETHVHGFGPALFDGVINDANGTFVVRLDWGGSLGVAHFIKGGAEGCGILGIIEKSACFSFRRGGEDSVHDGAMYVDGAVERGRCTVGTGRK